MKSMKNILIPCLVASSLIFPSVSYSASEDECAIWLCLPTGFGTGCSGAKSAFKKRIKKLKPPLPMITQCLSADAPSVNADFSHHDVAIINGRSKCVKWNSSKCETWSKVNTVEERRCFPREPYCTDKKEVKIFVDGEIYGEPFYY